MVDHHDESALTVRVVEADDPYIGLPEHGDVMLGWYVSEDASCEFGSRVIMLSDPCVGEPPIEDVIKTVSHEYLHDTIEQVEDKETSSMLDNIVSSADFIVDREENYVEDTRLLQERFSMWYGHRDDIADEKVKAE